MSLKYHQTKDNFMYVKANRKDVNKAFRNMDNLFREINRQAYLAARASAEDYNNTVRSGIGIRTTPSFVKKPWKPLSPVWKKKKSFHKDEFWIETGMIYRSIKVHIIQKTWKTIRIMAGIFKSDDYDAFKRAEKNEFGLGAFQPQGGRPLFRPAMDKMSTRLSGGIRRLKKNSMAYGLFKNTVRSAIRKVYK